MSECERCKKEIITFSSARWEPTGIELDDLDGKPVKLCWECYSILKKGEE